jgi:predicted metal-dependent peptidase
MEVTMKVYTDQEKIDRARLDLAVNFPFFSTVFLRLNVFEDPTCPTAWTDGNSIGYNLQYLASLKPTQIIGVFVHECLHVILKHHLRAALDIRYKTQHKRFNYACDYALNPIIKNTKGMDIHENWLYEDKWADELAEIIFEQLPTKESDPLYGDAGDQPGEVRPWPGDGKGNGKPTEAEIDQKSQEVDQWIKAGEFKSQGAGKLTGSVKQIIKTATTPSVCWQDHMQFICEEITKSNYTWERPNSRYIQFGTYLPSMSGKKAVDMLFFVDTSGSLSDRQLSQIATEIQTIVSAFSIRVVVVYWDTGFRDIEIFEPTDVLDPEFGLDIKGRGGTGFGDCWDWIDDNQDEFEIDPKAIIFFSDLECSEYPADEPGMPVLWAQVPSYGNRFDTSYIKYLPDYGEHVKVPIYREGD